MRNTSELSFKIDGVSLRGNLTVPEEARGIILFSHGSGSSRHSPRNQYVAKRLNQHQFATFLFDLLTEQEDRNYQTRFDIDLLSRRLAEITRNLHSILHEQADLPLGYFGASTGAASALQAAAVFPDKVKAVVSRGGRPDLAMQALPKVQAPVLLIVGSLDEEVIGLNQKAFEQLKGTTQLEIVEGASHLFEEPGKLGEVAQLAAGWFQKYL